LSSSQRLSPPPSGEAGSAADRDVPSDAESGRSTSSSGPDLWAMPVFAVDGGHPAIRSHQNFAIVAARSGSVAVWVRCCCHKSRYRRASSWGSGVSAIMNYKTAIAQTPEFAVSSALHPRIDAMQQKCETPLIQFVIGCSGDQRHGSQAKQG
jgi:hypothetical protein